MLRLVGRRGYERILVSIGGTTPCILHLQGVQYVCESASNRCHTHLGA